MFRLFFITCLFSELFQGLTLINTPTFQSSIKKLKKITLVKNPKPGDMFKHEIKMISWQGELYRFWSLRSVLK